MLLLATTQDRSAGWADFPTPPKLQAPARWNRRLPLSDQKNSGRWVPYAVMSDEFNGSTLDKTKWHDHNPGWKGRQPAFFSPNNVRVRDGSLQLTMRVEEPPEALRAEGYKTFSSAAVKSVGTVLYGYFEVRARPMRSHGSSAFWFYHGDEKKWTEIDVFEIGAGAPGFERKYHMNAHVFHDKTSRNHWAIGGVWLADRDLADGYRVYGLEWTKEAIKFYVDGKLVRQGPNTHWDQALTMNFDTETMPDWFGLPNPNDLPSTYHVDYVRAWKAPG